MGLEVDVSMMVFVAFLILKLTDAITWSWWWVTSPIWIPIVLMLIIVAILTIIYGFEKTNWRWFR